MARTTIDIDSPLLKELKRLQQAEKKPLGRLVSDLLSNALDDRGRAKRRAKPFKWIAQDMRAKIDIADKEALYAVLDRKGG